MKESVLDVLMYLLDHYADDDAEQDREVLSEELSRAGFGSLEVDNAFEWLASLGDEPPQVGAKPRSGQAVRVYAAAECRRLSVEARGFLMLLEHSAIIDSTALERVVDRAMALDAPEQIDAEAMRWIALMVLCNQPQTAHLHASLEALAAPLESRRVQ
jgi:Smg protein